MSENDENINVLLDELSKFTSKLIKLEYYFKDQDSLINERLNGYDTKFNTLNEELSDFDENISKMQEYLLLELESNLDKHKMIQLKNEKKYDDLLVAIKADGDDRISSLNQEIGALKQTLNDKTQELKKLDFKNDDLNSLLKQKELEIDDLNEKIERFSSAKDLEIKKVFDEKNSEINELKDILNDRDGEIVSLNEKVNEIYAIKDSEIKRIFNEKTSEIDSLNGLLKERDEEITALNEKVDIINDVVQIVEDNDKIIGALGDDISQFEADLADKTDQNSLLMDENTFLRNNLNEKINQIGYLNEEIQVLKDIIEEKDKTIDFLKGDE